MRRYVTMLDEMLNCSARVGRAGASIVEETGDMKVKQDTRMVAVHFLYFGQFFGLEGSFGPSHVTYYVVINRGGRSNGLGGYVLD